MIELFYHGGWLLAAIVALSIGGWTLAVGKWLELRETLAEGARRADTVIRHVRAREVERAMAVCRDHANAFSRMIMASICMDETDPKIFARRIRPLLNAEAAGMRRHLPLIGTAAAILPLLGLLGTVVGIVRMFAAITEYGSMDLYFVADGISHALVTTQAGLAMGMPLVLCHGWLGLRAQCCIDTMTQYSKEVQVSCLTLFDNDEDLRMRLPASTLRL